MSKYRGPSESVTQQQIMEWTDFRRGKHPELELLFHIPNGGMRNKAVAGQLKAEGVKAGVPDLFLPVPRGGYHGLFIELKVGKNKTTAHQDWWLGHLTTQGYFACVSYGFTQTTQLLERYLSLPKPAIP